MSSPSSPKSLSPLRLTALTASSAVTTMKAAPGPGSASPVAESITPMPQRSQTRRRSSGRPASSSSGPPQREQKRIVSERSRPGAGGRLVAVGVDGHRRSESIRTRGPRDSPALRRAMQRLVVSKARRRRTLRSRPGRGSLLRAGSTQHTRRRMAVQQELWGPETSKAVENFQVSGERVPVPVVRWLGRIKAEAARVNGELGLLDAELAERIAARGRRGGCRRARRPVPDRRLPDRLRDLHEHERQRGDREPRRRGRPPQRSREHGAVLERRVPLRRAPGGGGRGARRAAARDRAPGRGARRARRASSRTW